MRQRKATILAISALALFLGACVHHSDLPVASDAPAGQQMPFRATADESGNSPTASLTQQVPTGTAVEVQLTLPISSASAKPGDVFHGSLNTPVMLGDLIAIPGGAAIEGRVLAADASKLPEVPGYLRLTLTAVSVSGRLLPIQTSTLFAKGGPRRKASAGSAGLVGASAVPAPAKLEVELPAGQSLTFRLSQAFTVPN